MPKFRRADGPEDHAIVITLWLDESGVTRGDVLGRLVQEGGIFKRHAVPIQGDLSGKEAVHGEFVNSRINASVSAGL